MQAIWQKHQRWRGKVGALLVTATDRAAPSHTSTLTHYMITHNVYPQTKCVWKTITFKEKSVLLKFYYADCSLRKLNLQLDQLLYAAMKRVPTAVKSGVPSKCVHFLSSKALAGSKMPKINTGWKTPNFQTGTEAHSKCSKSHSIKPAVWTVRHPRPPHTDLWKSNGSEVNLQQHTPVTGEGRPHTLLFVVPRPGEVTEAEPHACVRRNHKTTCKQFKPRYRLILTEVHCAYPMTSLNMDTKTSAKSAYVRKK